MPEGTRMCEHVLVLVFVCLCCPLQVCVCMDITTWVRVLKLLGGLPLLVCHTLQAEVWSRFHVMVEIDRACLAWLCSHGSQVGTGCGGPELCLLIA